MPPDGAKLSQLLVYSISQLPVYSVSISQLLVYSIKYLSCILGVDLDWIPPADARVGAVCPSDPRADPLRHPVYLLY